MQDAAEGDERPRRPSGQSIRSRLMLLVAASVLPVLLFAVVAVYRGYAGEREAFEWQVLDTARALSLAVDRELQSEEAALQVLALSPALRSGDIAAFRRQAVEFLETKRAGTVIIVSDVTGQQLVHTAMPEGGPLPRRGSLDPVHRVFETGEAHVTDLFTGAVARAPVVGVEMPVLRDGAVIYDLTLGVPLDTFADLLAEQRLPPEWVGAVLDRQGVHIARTHQSEQHVGRKGPPELVERIRAVEEGSVEMTTLDGVPVFAAFSRSMLSGWTVVIALPQALLQAPLWRSLRIMLAGGAVLLLLALLMAAEMARRTVKPVRALADSARALGRGESPPPPPPGVIEVDEVGEALVLAAAEHARADAALRSSEAQLRLVADAMPVLIAYVDAEQRYVFNNQTYEEWFAVERDALRGRHMRDVLGEAGYAIIEPHVAAALRGVAVAFETHMQYRNGSTRWIDARYIPHVAADGRVLGFHIFVDDITERRRAQEALTAAAEQKEILYREMSHRVVNGFQLVQGMLTMQQRGIRDEDARRAVEMAAHRVQSMALVHRRLYSGSGGLGDVEVADYLGGLCDDLRDALLADSRCQTLRVDATPGVLMSADRVVTVGLLVAELVTNACKHAYAPDQPGTIAVHFEAAEDGHRLTVADDGIGLPADFDPAAAKGLGMRIIQGLTRQLDGELDVERTAPGTCFGVTIPPVSA